MPTYQFIAQAGDGSRLSGTLVAGNRSEALTTLAGQRKVPLSLKELRPKRTLFPGGGTKHMFRIYSGLADLLESGLPLLRALEIIGSQIQHRAYSEALKDIRQLVANGTSLADAMRSQSQLFDELAIDMIAVGEEAGCLELSLKRVAQLAESRSELRGRVAGAMVYPAFLLAVGVIVASGMFLFFVPAFEPLFERMRERGELPAVTSLLIDASSLARSHWMVIALVLAAMAIAILHFARTTSGRMRLDQWLLSIPGCGPVVFDLILARFSHLLGTMLASGVPILRALELSLKTMGNVYLQVELKPLLEAVSNGGSLADQLRTRGVLPVDFVETVAIAEQANRLEQSLLSSAERLERRAKSKLETLTKMIEPILMTMMAAIIGLLIIALLLPIFTTSGQF